MPLIQGTVQDKQGLPVPNAIIAVELSTVPFPDMAICSNEEGNFALYLPKGHFRIGVHFPEGGYESIECDSADVNEHLFIRLGGS